VLLRMRMKTENKRLDVKNESKLRVCISGACLAIAMLFLLSGCSTDSNRVGDGLPDDSFDNNANSQINSIPIPAGVTVKTLDNATRERNPLCPGSDIKSICGTDGKTYLNECELGLGDAQIAYYGACESSGAKIDGTSCVDEKSPVCAYTGYTYMNKCLAAFYNQTVSHPGACPPIGCKKEGTVCSMDNKTYVNECTALRFNATIAHEGKCA
jgi:hypothetical protein